MYISYSLLKENAILGIYLSDQPITVFYCNSIEICLVISLFRFYLAWLNYHLILYSEHKDILVDEICKAHQVWGLFT